MKLNRLNTYHVQPQNPLFTSDSQHPPRSRHAVHLGEELVYGFPVLVQGVNLRDFASMSTIKVDILESHYNTDRYKC